MTFLRAISRPAIAWRKRMLQVQPHFCSMKLAEDVSKYAGDEAIGEEEALCERPSSRVDRLRQIGGGSARKAFAVRRGIRRLTSHRPVGPIYCSLLARAEFLIRRAACRSPARLAINIRWDKRCRHVVNAFTLNRPGEQVRVATESRAASR